MQKRRDDELDPGVLVDRVGKRMPVISAVSSRALTKFRIGIAGLRYTRLAPDEDEARIIEAIQRSGFELFLNGLRRQMLIGAHRTEVWHDEKDSFRLPALRQRILVRACAAFRRRRTRGHLCLLLSPGGWIVR